MKKSSLLKLSIVFCLCAMMSGNANAQNWKSILSGVASAVTGNKSTASASSIVGTWKYSGPDCKFQSDNLLAKAGGEVASTKVEDKMNGIMSKLGFNENSVFVFNEDSTYTSTVAGKTVKGTYSYDSANNEIHLKTKVGLKFTATVSQSLLSSNKMSLLFKADKMMSLVQSLCGTIGKVSSNAAVSSANSLLSEFDGLDLGIALEKQ